MTRQPDNGTPIYGPPLRERPDWDLYFLRLASQVAERSCDPSTQHGCVLVLDKIPVMTGYNGLPAGTDDGLYPQERPAKYWFYCHSEENAVALAARRGVATDGATAYVTGPPCVRCLRLLWQAGIRRVVHWARRGWSLDEAEADARKLLLGATGLLVGVVELEAGEAVCGAACCAPARLPPPKPPALPPVVLVERGPWPALRDSWRGLMAACRRLLGLK